MYSGYRHGETQRNSQQVQSHAAGFRLHQPRTQRSGKEINNKTCKLIKMIYIFISKPLLGTFKFNSQPQNWPVTVLLDTHVATSKQSYQRLFFFCCVCVILASSWWRSWWRWATSPTRPGRWLWPSPGWTVCCRSSSTRFLLPLHPSSRLTGAGSAECCSRWRFSEIMRSWKQVLF